MYNKNHVKFSPKKILNYDSSADTVILKGEMGERCLRSIQRISNETPYNEDYILKQITNDDRVWTNFPCCHGDIAGRWIWAQALAHSADDTQPEYLTSLVEKAIKCQQSDGHFGNKTISPGVETMLGAYGNGWMLKGASVLLAQYPNQALESSLRKHVQWYIDQYPYWESVSKKIKERDTEYYAVTPSGYFHGLAGLSSAYKITQEKKILPLAQNFIDNLIPLSEADHSHSFLTVRRGALEFAELNDDQKLIRSIESELESVWGEFVLESGGIPERFVHFDDGSFHDDEACSHADWMLLCLKMHKLTENPTWLERAILCLENQFFYNQTINGGFGSRLIKDNTYLQMGKEAYWCCSLYGPSLLIEAASYFVELKGKTLHIHHHIEGELNFNGQVVNLSWDDALQQYTVDLSLANDIDNVSISQTRWVKWKKTNNNKKFIYHAQWQFWNGKPNAAPDAVTPKIGKSYTQFIGPWMLSARSAKNVDHPAVPMRSLLDNNLVSGLNIRTISGMPLASKSIQVAVPSDIELNIYDVFAWPNQPKNQLLLYPLKDKESPDDMKVWFTASDEISS